MDGVREKFLIIRLGAIGDIIHCLPVANFLKENFPDAQIDWVVDEKCAALLNNNPLIDNVYCVPLSKWKKNWFENGREIAAFNKKLAKEHYTWAFDLHGMFKSLIIFAFCGAKKRVSYSDYRELAPLGANVLVKPKSKRPHVNYHIMKRNLDLILNCGLINPNTETKINVCLPDATIGTVEKITNLLHGIDENKPVYVFAPATTWKTKHWNIAEWQKLFSLTKNDANIIFTGTENDLALINEITQGDIRATILAGKTNLEEYVEVLKRADCVISPDSSAAHLAFALKKPKVITVFTSTSAKTFAPPNSTPLPNTPLCPPCFKHRCKYKHENCTRQTTAEEIFEAIRASHHTLTKH